MAHYQLKIAYDGTDFLGFQKQGKGRTVQNELEKALRKLAWNGNAIQFAGRTDTGVHASGQVIAFEFIPSFESEKMIEALNANLPSDIVVNEVKEVSKDFHPRFSAKSRKYVYRLYCQEQRDPFRDRFAWQVWPKVDYKILQKTARKLVGEHDFCAFGKPPREESGTIRKIIQASWEKAGDDFRFVITGNSFLYHMVRRMVFLQVQVAQGRIAMDDFQMAIDGGKGIKPGIAPARGLELNEINY